LAISHLAITVLAAGGVLGSVDDKSWATGLALLLITVSAAGLWRMAVHSPVGRLRLYTDGSGILTGSVGRVPVEQRPGAWATRWLSVVPLARLDSGSILRCVVCRSGNRAGAYRRLLAWLRLRSSGRAARPLPR